MIKIMGNDMNKIIKMKMSTVFFLAMSSSIAIAEDTVVTNVFVAGEPALAAEVNENFSDLAAAIDAKALIAGPKGDTGAASTLAGPKGDTGAASTVAGPKGDTGAASTLAGPKGDKGDAGAASTVAGPKGDKGDAGAASTVAGPKGDTGAASTVAGPKGDTGAASTLAGPKGDKGDAGAASTVAGPKGDKGDTGAASTVAGPKGDKGDTGAGVPDGAVAGDIIVWDASDDGNVATLPAYKANNPMLFDGALLYWDDGSKSYIAGGKPSYTINSGNGINNIQPYQAINYIIALYGAFPSRSGIDSPTVGEITMFGGSFAPTGWAYCNGQILSIVDNQALFALLGANYGGNGRTTFGLPDLRGRVPMGAGSHPWLTSRRLGEKGGIESTFNTIQ
jgi:microcystin-dependent protein